MAQNPSTHEEKVRSFWDRYVQSLHESGIQPPFDRWVVIRAEQYIAAYPDRKLMEQMPENVDAYLAELGRKPGLKSWQFRQAVDAIRNLFILAGVNWLDQVDWDHWRASAHGLAPDHPTVARDYRLVPGGRTLEPRDGLALASIRQAQGPLLERVIRVIRARGYAIRTEQTYLHWILRYLGFIGQREATEAGAKEVAAYLEHLAVERKVSASTQNLALNALVFLYREVLQREDLNLGEFARAKRPRRLPTVLTHAEVTALLGRLSGTQRLMASLMYGTGMRLMECVRLRVQELLGHADVSTTMIYTHVLNRGGKGVKSPLDALV